MPDFTIAVTGITGAMGEEVYRRFSRESRFHLRLFVRSKKGIKKRFPVKKDGAEVSFVQGDLRNEADCLSLVQGADVVLHMAALIPPMADHNPQLAEETNFYGTKYITDAVLKDGNRALFLMISTVALYGNRDEQHPYGRVGDPLVVSDFDSYGASKKRAERYVLDAALNRFVILRQTAVLYDGMISNSLRDGLMFHMPLNTPVEWVTASDSARLLYRLIVTLLRGEGEDLLNRVYNIGGGPACRQTGFESYRDGFSVIGADAKKVFRPDWFASRNFHCMWFTDSDVLEERFHFRREGITQFWEAVAKRHPHLKQARILPAPLLKRLLFLPLQKNKNAPSYWKGSGKRKKVKAFFGGYKAARAQSADWAETTLWCDSEDYESAKEGKHMTLLSHGYDTEKAEAELTLEDVREAAAFRGGSCLSCEMQQGDLYTKLSFRCHEGHVFAASPYTVLKAGHWCEACEPEGVWRMGVLAEHVPFYAQVWYDTHDAREKTAYRLEEERDE
ncbi:MAG: NAD(P)-dependent oxidoreductase [Lachnospiraceae bacterium]|nr:NAD(P)-dependent oxidoreductase [Lachnospiraceae bacterium]